MAVALGILRECLGLMSERRSMLSSSEVVAAILDKPTDLAHMRTLVTEDMTHVSWNYDNPDLHSIMPWCRRTIVPVPKGSSRPSSMPIATGRCCHSR
jgi:hypothetical protein